MRNATVTIKAIKKLFEINDELYKAGGCPDLLNMYLVDFLDTCSRNNIEITVKYNKPFSNNPCSEIVLREYEVKNDIFSQDNSY